MVKGLSGRKYTYDIGEGGSVTAELCHGPWWQMRRFRTSTYSCEYTYRNIRLDMLSVTKYLTVVPFQAADRTIADCDLTKIYTLKSGHAGETLGDYEQADWPQLVMSRLPTNVLDKTTLSLPCVLRGSGTALWPPATQWGESTEGKTKLSVQHNRYTGTSSWFDEFQLVAVKKSDGTPVSFPASLAIRYQAICADYPTGPAKDLIAFNHEGNPLALDPEVELPMLDQAPLHCVLNQTPREWVRSLSSSNWRTASLSKGEDTLAYTLDNAKPIVAGFERVHCDDGNDLGTLPDMVTIDESSPFTAATNLGLLIRLGQRD